MILLIFICILEALVLDVLSGLSFLQGPPYHTFVFEVSECAQLVRLLIFIANLVNVSSLVLSRVYMLLISVTVDSS